MKILILTNFDLGLYKFRKELVEKLMEEHDITIALPAGQFIDQLKSMGCHIIETPMGRRDTSPIQDIGLLCAYHKIIKNENPDKVITYTIKPNIYGGIACRLAKKDYFANITGLGTAFERKGILRNLVVHMYRTGLKRTKKVFFENRENANTIISYGIIPREKACIMHGAGVNLETYSFTEYPKNDRIRFLYVGRIMKEKGIDELFHAIRRLSDEKFDFILDIVGFFEEEYSDQVKELEDIGVVKYHGYQPDPRPYYTAADCIVLPSYHEGMSNVLLEAASMGRPLITSDIPGCREAVSDEKNGFLVKSRDQDSLYEAMKRFLGLPVEKRSEMGMLSRQKMEQEFDKNRVVEITISELNK